MKVEELNIIQKAEIIKCMAIELKEERDELSMYQAYLIANSNLNNLEEIDYTKYIN